MNDKISNIDELDNIQLNYYGNGTDYEKKDVNLIRFQRIFTANILSW